MASELSEQMSLVKHLTKAGLFFCAIPNGGKRDGKTARILAMSGVRRGAPDLLVFDPPPVGGYVGLAIELKRVKGGKPSKAQIFWQKALTTRGWYATVSSGSHEALLTMRSLGYRV